MVESRAITRLFLLRHGQVTAQSRGRCYGWLDVPMADEGRLQVAHAAEYLKAEPFVAIYTSPLRRATESAGIIAAGRTCPITTIADLCEINFGDFEGLSYDEIAARHSALYQQWMTSPTTVQFPNGESLPQMRMRVLRAFDMIRYDCQGKTAAIVSHAGVNRLLIAWALQMSDQHLFRIGQSEGAINLITFVEEEPNVRLLNYVHGDSK